MFTLAAKAKEPGLVEAARLIGAAADAAAARSARGRRSARILTPFPAARSALRRAQCRRGRGARRRRRGRLAARAARSRPTARPAPSRFRRTFHDRAFHRRGARRARPRSPCAGAISSRAAPSASMPARSCRKRCSIIARPARRSSTPRRSISTRSWRSASSATAAGKDVARLHSGDLSIFSAMGEQLRRLDKAGVPYDRHARRARLRRRRGGAQARTDACPASPNRSC